MAVTSGFVGLKEANRALRSLPEWAKPGLQKVMDTTGYRVSSRASATVARRTGFLQARIKWQSRPRTLAAVVGVAPEAFYWKFLEYGTVKMQAQPFLRPAAQAEEGQHGQAVVDALKRVDVRLEQATNAATSRLL